MYEAVPEARQRSAMGWLGRQVFETPDWLLNESVLRRIEGAGALERMRRFQVGAIDLLLDPYRMMRMIEAEALASGDVYACTEMLADLRGSVWKELSSGEAVDAFRRNLQRGHLERLEFLLTEEPPAPPQFYAGFGQESFDASQSDVRAYARGELEAVRSLAQRAVSRVTDRVTQLHLRDVVARIDEILDTD